MSEGIRRIGVLTSGGDSPGYNACIRSVVRMSIHYGWEPYGIRNGFNGLVAGDMEAMTSRSVSGIIGRGGTILGASRSSTFQTERGIREALRHLNEEGLDALVVVGGDGTMRGAAALADAGVPVVGVPGTIENDVCGTDIAVGVDTAMNTAIDAIDRIKDTASSQEQTFLVEVMGEKCGYLALMVGIAGGAEFVCVPEVATNMEELISNVADAYVRGKKNCIITVAEGAKPNAREIADYLQANEDKTGFGVRLCILGHILRGGSPSAADRFLGTRLGAEAVRLLHEGQSRVMVGIQHEKMVPVPIDEAVSCTRQIEDYYFELARVMAR